MGIVEAIILGIIQGASEFLPISSTGHLRIIPSLLGWQDPGAGFTAVIQLGTLAAVLLYFRKDLLNIFTKWAGSIANKELRKESEAKIGWGIFFGTLPIMVLGYLLQDFIEGSLRSLYVVATMLIFMGLLMLVAEKATKATRKFDDVTLKDGLIVGLWQAVALIPGASRSGSTITGALFSKLDRETAARFSFLLSVPSIFAAGIYSLYKHRADILSSGLTATLIATVVSFAVGYASIAFLMSFLQKRGTTPFVAYRVILGLVLIGLLQTGKLDPMAGTPQESDVSKKTTSNHRTSGMDDRWPRQSRPRI